MTLQNIVTFLLLHAAEAIIQPLDLQIYGNKKFYIYPMDADYWYRLPVPEAPCQGPYQHYMSENSGLGKVIDLDHGLLDTWQLSLFSSLYNRLKRSRRRTRDPAEAELFIIPFDFFMDSLINQKTCKLQSKSTYELIVGLERNLSASPYFQRYNGADHVVLNSGTSWGTRTSWPRIGGPQFISDFCRYCLKTCYLWIPTQSNQFIALPFPTTFHWWEGVKKVPWSLEGAAQRDIFAVFMGSLKTRNGQSNKLRRKIISSSKKDSGFHYITFAHGEGQQKEGDYLIYTKSVFCMCPPGDDDTRRGLTDSILSGCIPVTFRPATFLRQLKLYLGNETRAQELGVYFNFDSVVNNKVSIMDELRKIPAHVIASKQKLLAELAPRMQYSMPRIEYLQDKYDETPFDPPFPDAMDVFVDGMIALSKRNIRNETLFPERDVSNPHWQDDILF